MRHGHKLIPIASDGHPCVGLDLSSDMLAEAQRKANERGVAVEWMQGDMRAFDLGRTFDFVFIAARASYPRDVAPLDQLRARLRRRTARNQEHLPQELPLLVSLGGLRLVERFGDWSSRPFAVDTPLQLCISASA